VITWKQKFFTALIASGFSLVIAILSAIISYFLGKKSQMLASGLQSKRSEENAQLDYIYEARKRLYRVCDPLFFLSKELSSEAKQRIIRLAQAKKEGKLPTWMNHYGYFFLSTIYILIIPIAVYKLIQKQLTLVDFSLDHKIIARYQLIKCIAKAFRDDFKFAKLEPILDYNPSNIFKGPHENQVRKQGLHAGRLDNAAEALIVKEENRVMSYGEFAAKFNEVKNKQENPFDGLVCAFEDFDPDTSPVLWRILVTQYYLYYALDCACEFEEQKNKNCPEKIKEFISEAMNDVKMREELEMSEQDYDRIWKKNREVAKLWLEERLYKPFEKTDLSCSQRSCSMK
jgi:hypothetical protein